MQPVSHESADRLESATLRWSNLADRRLAYFIELYRSGRWRHYYDEREFLERIRDVKFAATEWDRLSRDSVGNGVLLSA
jgi:uncharacterized repeat protein (TIGR03809 family)